MLLHPTVKTKWSFLSVRSALKRLPPTRTFSSLSPTPNGFRRSADKRRMSPCTNAYIPLCSCVCVRVSSSGVSNGQQTGRGTGNRSFLYAPSGRRRRQFRSPVVRPARETRFVVITVLLYYFASYPPLPASTLLKLLWTFAAFCFLLVVVYFCESSSTPPEFPRRVWPFLSSKSQTATVRPLSRVGFLAFPFKRRSTILI